LLRQFIFEEACRLEKTAKKVFDEELKRRRQSILSSLGMFQTVGGIILDKKIDDENVRKAIFSQVPSDVLAQQISQLDDWITGKRSHQFSAFIRQFNYLRKFSPAFLKSLEFEDSHATDTPLVEELLQKRTDLDHRIVSAETNLRKQLAQPKDKQNPDRIQKLKETLDNLKLEEMNTLKIIEEQYPRYAELTQPQPVTLTELRQNVLRENEVLLEYVVMDEMTAAFVVSREAFEWVKVEMMVKELTEKVTHLRATLVDPTETFDRATAYELYTKLWKPVEKYLTDAEVVYIVPDGPLYYLPFETLITTNKPRDNGSDFLLTKDYHLAYIQSASILKTVREDQKRREASREEQEPIVVFADPVYPQEGQIALNRGAGDLRDAFHSGGDHCAEPRFGRLESTAKEAESIASIYQVNHNSDAFNLRDKARESRVKNLDLSTYRYVHFATHGILCDETKGAWLQSSLVLSLVGESETEQEKGNEGFLQMSEVFNLKLNADLVTLSACETGLGRADKGEGLVGLTRGFMYAGTPSVVVSLWRVSDSSTAQFMTEFYTALSEGMTKVATLKETKQFMIAESYHTSESGEIVRHNHPYYWAPFILIGAPQ